MGRRNKDIPNQSELLVDDTDHEGGVVYHTMPTSSSAKKRLTISIIDNILICINNQNMNDKSNRTCPF